MWPPPKKKNFLFSSLSRPSLLVNSTGKSTSGQVMILPCFFVSVWLYYTVVSLICLFVPHFKGKNIAGEKQHCCFAGTHFPPSLSLLTVQTEDVIIRQAKFEMDVEVLLPQTSKNT